MRRRADHFIFIAAGSLVATAAMSAPAAAQLRVVSLNGSNFSSSTAAPRGPWTSTILSAIGSSVSDDPYFAGNTGIAKPIDVLCLQEVHSAATTSAGYASLLNALYPTANYQHGTLDGASTGSGTQGVVYNANALTLISEAQIGSSSTAGQPRTALRYRFRPVGYEPSADVYVYNSHYKAGNTSSDRSRRLPEAQAIRADADALGSAANVIYAGDLNVYSSTETMYQALIVTPGAGRAVDPIDKPGNWSDNTTFRRAHTQSPFSASTAMSLGTGYSGTAGGMDDRFDFQLVNANVADGDGFAYIAGSYHAFGNNGSHPMNEPINHPANTAQPANVLDALAGVLDHLPVVADYQLPAKLSASVDVSAVPPAMMRGHVVALNVNVANAAPVQFASGADDMPYLLNTTGDLSGEAAASDAALGGGNVHAVTLDTSIAGARGGDILVSSSAQQVANNHFTQAVAFDVLDPASPSFSATSEQTSALADFGYVPVGSNPRTLAMALHNRETVAGFTAALDVDDVTAAGDIARLWADGAAALDDLPAGAAAPFTVRLSSATTGVLSSSYAWATSDQDLPGAQPRATLTLTAAARVFDQPAFPVTGHLFLPADEPLDMQSFAIGAGVTLTRTGPGAMTVAGPQAHGSGARLVVADGSVHFATNANGALALSITGDGVVSTDVAQRLASLDITNAAQLDLRHNNLVLHGADLGSWNGAAYTGITGLIAAGRNGGAWDGAGGIITSAPDAAALVTTLAVGVAPADATWAGQPVSAGDVLVMYTYAGDVDMNGMLDADDYFYIDQHINRSGTIFGFHSGDVDLNGFIDGDDYFYIDQHILNQSLGVFPTSAAARVSPIPEPSTAACVFAQMLFIVTRAARTRRASHRDSARRANASRKRGR